METSKENIINAYNIAKQTGADSTCKVLEALYPDIDFTPIENRPITERIKTFEDACDALGCCPGEVEQMWENGCLTEPDEIAYQKLRMITAALNEGWEPQFTEDENRWYPWFILYTEEELANKDEEWKQEHCLRPTSSYKGEWAGFAFAFSSSAPSYSGAIFGSRLCFKNESLAEYAGMQFIDLYMDLYLIRK